MFEDDATRRNVLRALAAMPAAGLLLRTDVTMAGIGYLILVQGANKERNILLIGWASGGGYRGMLRIGDRHPVSV